MVHTTNAHTVVHTVEFAFLFLDERKKEFKSFFHNAYGKKYKEINVVIAWKSTFLTYK